MYDSPFVVSPSFDKLRTFGKTPFALRLSKGRTVCSGQALSNHELAYDTVSRGEEVVRRIKQGRAISYPAPVE
jgi:hypothetical protein